MNYVVWTVYDKSLTRYYVINQFASKNKVQSTWKSGLEAKAVCDKLNKEVVKENDRIVGLKEMLEKEEAK